MPFIKLNGKNKLRQILPEFVLKVIYSSEIELNENL